MVHAPQRKLLKTGIMKSSELQEFRGFAELQERQRAAKQTLTQAIQLQNMDEPEHPAKRRRLSDERIGVDRYSVKPPSSPSAEDLARAEADIDRLREEWALRETAGPRDLNNTTPLRRDDTQSPEPLAADYEEAWDAEYSGHHDDDNHRLNNNKSLTNGTYEHLDYDAYAETHGGPSETQRHTASWEQDPQEGPSQTTTPIPGSPLRRPRRPKWRNYKLKAVLRGHERGVSAVKFSPDGTMIASCSADGTIWVRDTKTGNPIHVFAGHLAGISTISWSPDSTIIASGSDDKSIRLWNVRNGKPHPVPFMGHHNYVYSIAFCPKGNILVSGSYDEAVYLWDVRCARVMRSLPAHSDPVAGVDVVRDGTLIASCASDGLIRIWDTGTGQCLKTMIHEDLPPASAVKFSPNGKYVLAWTHDHCVRLWDYVAGKCIKTYQGHVNEKYSICGTFGVYGSHDSPEAQRPNTQTSEAGSELDTSVAAFAVSGSEDGAIVCWDVVTKKVLQKWFAHNQVCLGVDTLYDGKTRLIASCSLDGTVKIWEESPDSPAEEEPDELNRDGALAAVNGDRHDDIHDEMHR